MKKTKVHQKPRPKDFTNHHEGSIIKGEFDKAQAWKKAHTQVSKSDSITN
jgi:hypothetical protein